MSANILLRSRLFTVERVEFATRAGHQITRDIIRHPGSVVILPVLNDFRVCLIRNFRVAVDSELIELPAGTLEPPEPPRQCAQRELIEETGYRAGQMELVTSFYPAPGILDEQMHLFVASDLTEGVPAREPGEQIENMVVRFGEAMDMIKRGEIQDAKTIVGLILCAERFPVDDR